MCGKQIDVQLMKCPVYTSCMDNKQLRRRALAYYEIVWFENAKTRNYSQK